MSKWLEQQKRGRSQEAKSLTVTLRKILWEGLDERVRLKQCLRGETDRQGRDLVPAGQEARVEVQKSYGKLH